MKNNNITVTFWFNEIRNVKEVRDKFDEKLSDYFNPFNLTGAPLEVDPIVPRIVSKTKGGHTTLQFSLINLQLNTSFDNEFNFDINKCIEYVKEKAYKVFKILKEDVNIEVLYSAIFLNCDKDSESPLQEIADRYNISLNNKTEEIGLRFSEVVNDKYYFITSLNNSSVVSITKKIEPGQQPQRIVLPLISKKEMCIEKEIISYTFEINDKYEYNTIDKCHTTNESITDMFEIFLNKIISINSDSKEDA